MRIGFNLLSLPGNRLYGVGAFLREMCTIAATELPRRDAELVVFHHTDCDPGRLFGLELSSRVRWIGVPGVTPRTKRILWEQLAMPSRLEGIEVLYSPNNINPLLLPPTTRSIVTIHDLLPFDDETRFGSIQRLYLRRFTRAAVRRAARVITVSATSANDITARLGVPLGRIAVVHNVVERPANVVPNTVEFGRSFVILASLHRDKRIDLALHGFHRFLSRCPGHRLAVFGADHGALGELRSLVAELGLQDSVDFKGYVDTATKWSALTACLGVLLFGRKEGFGIPVLEAMAVGKPSIVAPDGALPEVVGDAGVIVAPSDTDAVARAMESIAMGPGIPAAFIARRYAQFDPATQRERFWKAIFESAPSP